MTFPFLRVLAGSRLQLDGCEPRTLRGDRPVIVICERGALLGIPAGIVALACPIAGESVLSAADWNVRLARGDIGIGDSQLRHDIAVSPRGMCIVLAGLPSAWAALGGATGGAQPARVLFPAVHRAARPLCRRVLRFLRQCLRGAGPFAAPHLALELARIVDDLQESFAEMIARCPGSSLARKRAVFLRLQRVRNYIGACAHHDLDVARLALMANYSIGHFITTFRAVFDETPYSNVSRYRLESASTLLSASTLGIADIAQAIGFQSRSSFSRAVRKHLGSSATEYRASALRFGGPLPATERVASTLRPGHRRTERALRVANESE